MREASSIGFEPQRPSSVSRVTISRLLDIKGMNVDFWLAVASGKPFVFRASLRIECLQKYVLVAH